MTTPNKVNIGVVGCGNISDIYFKNMQQFDLLNTYACADLNQERAKAKAEQYQIPKVLSVADLLADPQIDIVLNLTIPAAHADIALEAISARKSVYNEKPLAVRREDGKHILDLAVQQNVMVGGAPDTFLGGGLQTCRQLIDSGAIGEPVAATAFMISHGHESWHPDPEFYYKIGGGPMFDMGPYYLTALVSLLGPVRRVTGSTRITFPERTITSKPLTGAAIRVDVPTHVVGVLDFINGPIATIVTTFDVWSAELPRLEIYGTKGTLSLPDPNTFGGPVRVRLAGESDWSEVPLSHGYATNSRGLGLADMAYALRTGSQQRASGKLAYHVLDIMHAIHESSAQDQHIMLESACERPLAFPVDGFDQTR